MSTPTIQFNSLGYLYAPRGRPGPCGEEQDDEDARALVHSANEPAQRHVVRDVADRLVTWSSVGRGTSRGYACTELDEEAVSVAGQGLEPVDVRRDLPEEEVLGAADDPRPLLQPIERTIDMADLGRDPLVAVPAGGGRRPRVF
jgi:hypothetical protein